MYEVNGLAWSYFTHDRRLGHAEAYLQRERGIGVADLGAAVHAAPLVGYADHQWHGLIDHLHGHGVNDAETLDADLAHRPKNGRPRPWTWIDGALLGGFVLCIILPGNGELLLDPTPNS